ncbi:MBL fold metallo-hydrolase [Patescibacteria group bacterium]|nr:MBL fold metallo-hydrolase [Patescibacteria group bacterium]
MPHGFQIQTLVVGSMAANCYIVSDAGSGKSVIIDPGDDADYIISHVAALAIEPVAVVATHGHLDHIMAAFAVSRTFGVPFCLHPADLFLVKTMNRSAEKYLKIGEVDPHPPVDRPVKDGDLMNLGTLTLKVMHAPGHTPGSILLYERESRSLFSGDLVFADGLTGRTDFPYSDRGVLRSSLTVLGRFSGDVTVYPGHGASFSLAEYHTIRTSSETGSQGDEDIVII